MVKLRKFSRWKYLDYYFIDLKTDLGFTNYLVVYHNSPTIPCLEKEYAEEKISQAKIKGVTKY
jgi:hypothetical protein